MKIFTAGKKNQDPPASAVSFSPPRCLHYPPAAGGEKQKYYG
jgi:hypothetical protein